MLCSACFRLLRAARRCALASSLAVIVQAPVAAQVVTANLAIGDRPFNMALNPVTRKLYVANFNDGTLSILDDGTLRTLPVAAGPSRVVIDDTTGRVYVVCPAAKVVVAVDGGTDTVVGSAPTGANTVALAVNPLTQRIYATNSNDATVTVIDGVTLNVVATVPVGISPGPVVVDNNRNRAYVVNQLGRSVSVIDGQTNAVTTIPVATTGVVLGSLVIDAAIGTVYLGTGDGGRLAIIDGDAYSVSYLPLGGSVSAMVFDDIGRRIYVRDLANGRIAIVDAATLATTFVPTIPRPGVIVLNRVTNQIIVTALTGTDVSVIDAGTLAVRPVTTGATPFSAAVDPVLGLTYVANADDDTLSVLAPPQVIGFALPAEASFGSAPLALTATGGLSGNPVQFASLTPTVCRVAGSQLVLMTAGVCTVTADQAGGNFFLPAPTATRSINVVSGYTTTSLSVDPPVPLRGASATLTAMVIGASPGGVVAFTVSGKPLDGCGAVPLFPLPGGTDSAVAACPFVAAEGTIQVRAAYSGDTFNAASVAERSARIAVPGPGMRSGMWSVAGERERGWGLSVTQHGESLVNALFVYDQNGNPVWYVMPAGSWNADFTAYTGRLFKPTSAPFTAYTAARFAPGAPVGDATLTFVSASTARLRYTIDGITAEKVIERQRFGVPDGLGRLRVGDLWWAGGDNVDEVGWGMTINEDERSLFVVWFTYDAAGQTTWYVMPQSFWAGRMVQGELYATTGSPWLGVNYDPARLATRRVGSLSLLFYDADTAAMRYEVDGEPRVKLLSRQRF